MTAWFDEYAAGIALGDLLAVMQHQQPIRQALDGFDDVFDDENADTLVTDLADHLDHFFDLDQIQPRHDLIAQENLRLHRQGLCQLQPLAAGTSQFIRALIDIFAKPDEIQLSARLLAGFRQLGLSASASEQGAHRDVVQNRQAGKRPHDLEGASDAQPCTTICGQRARDRPSNRISPELGASVPLIRLISVVLPAPFGPITPRISPRCSIKLTSSTATRPAKRRVTC